VRASCRIVVRYQNLSLSSGMFVSSNEFGSAGGAYPNISSNGGLSVISMVSTIMGKF